MLLDFADISSTRKGKLYSELYTQIKNAVVEGVLKKGERLPSVREASSQLGVSRTTVENAYTRLCIEGIAESLPQRGYFIIGIPKTHSKAISEPVLKNEIKYDFSSRLVDPDASDTELWKKLVRNVLWDSGELNSYGEPQGEVVLRKALAEYSYKARGVYATADNIVVGAGVGPLLNILCRLLGRDITVGFENGGFKEARSILSDYGIKCFNIDSDQSGAIDSSLKAINPDILFLLPSALSKISPSSISYRRNLFCEWAETENKLIIEDDYNGELRYTARSITAFQRKAPQKTVYIGSFSKLLLPSVRIAYMVLPDFLARKFKLLSAFYNQTCGKIEQLALEKYIVSGALEKHLKKLRRLYYTKSQLLLSELEENLDFFKSATLFESSLTVSVELSHNFNVQEIIKETSKNGIKIADFKGENNLKLCFGGIKAEKIHDGIICLNKILKNL